MLRLRAVIVTATRMIVIITAGFTADAATAAIAGVSARPPCTAPPKLALAIAFAVDGTTMMLPRINVGLVALLVAVAAAGVSARLPAIPVALALLVA